MKYTVDHINKKLDWNKYQPNDPKTLILGSFNPFIPENKNLPDFYYGRIPSGGPGNKLWSSIGELNYNDKDYFKKNYHNKILELEKSKIYFLDLIEKIEFICNNKIVLEDYLIEKIYKNFEDKNIWTTRTSYKGETIHLKRTYNSEIIKLLNNSNSIKRIINTLGKTNGDFNFNQRDEEWIKFRNDLFNTCSKRKIQFVSKSISPSPSRQKQNEDKFKNWLKKYI